LYFWFENKPSGNPRPEFLAVAVDARSKFTLFATLSSSYGGRLGKVRRDEWTEKNVKSKESDLRD
jgi:hypothetical protein